MVRVKKEEKTFIEKVGGRKFFLTIIMFLLTFVALGLKWIDKDVFQYITYAIIIVYVGGNVVQKVGLSVTNTPKV